uniref:Uncharacterized protein n=1 Tax=Arundo donax TaxID=35708 RepID=A0A0A9GVW1_ARUDO
MRRRQKQQGWVGCDVLMCRVVVRFRNRCESKQSLYLGRCSRRAGAAS